MDGIQQVQSVEDNKSVQDVCKSNIISFDRRNLIKFLDSVFETVMKYQDDPEKVKIILDYAKSRVNNKLIFLKKYETFETFRRDILTQILVPGTIDGLKLEISSLSQSRDENVFHYGRRATQLRDNYNMELKMFYEAQPVPKELLQKNEEETVKRFNFGLQSKVQSSIKTTQPVGTSLETAIEMAIIEEAARSRINKKESAAFLGDIKDSFESSSSSAASLSEVNQIQPSTQHESSRPVTRGFAWISTIYKKTFKTAKISSSLQTGESGDVVE